MMKATAVLAAIAVSANAQYYQWNGKSTNFNEPDLWTGPVPSNPNDAVPKSTTVGTTQVRTWTMLPQGLTYTVGSKLNFQGNTKLVLGDGMPNSKTIISFAASTESQPVETSFTADFVNSDGQGTYYDYSCNLNWQKVNKDGTISVPENPPCTSDYVYVPSGKSWYISNYGTNAGARSIKWGKSYTSSTVLLDSCDSDQPLNAPVTFDFEVNSCKASFNFNSDDYVSFQTCPTSCMGVTVNTTKPDGTPQTIVVYNQGNRTGTVLNKDGGKLTKTTSDEFDINVSSNGTITISKKGSDKPIVVNDKGIQTSAPTASPSASPTASPSASPVAVISSESSSTAAGGMGIIIGAAVGGLVLIIIVVLALFFVLKKGPSDSDERNVVSFENPMYDDVASKENPAFGQDEDTGIYDDPEMANESSGYMDVPSNNDASGYMDVPANNGVVTGGYMDVAPNAEDDSEEESDSEQEDI